ncbi:MAG: hypothetical protein JWO33_2704 [Caulobacteraceae bacterium]|nr:hypothetical protein [Caulobacteraceae bacterium]
MEVRTVLAALALAAALGAAPLAHAQDCAGDGAGRLTVMVDGLRSASGEVAVTVYPDDPRRFLARRGKLYRLRVPTRTPTTGACFMLPAGVYALAVYHDADGDRDFDRSKTGLPTEGFGFSNDAPTRVGLPSFDTVRFRYRPGDKPIRIRMRYR